MTRGAEAQGFADRVAGGQALGILLAGRLGPSRVGTGGRPLVLALPRGGVPVGAVVAHALGADLDVLVVRKIGAPGHAEFGVGAVAEDEQPIFDQRHLAQLGLGPEDLADTVAREIEEVRRRTALYRGDRPAPRVAGRLVIVVDDGLATGATARAALRSLRRAGPARLVFAAPVCAADAPRLLRDEADEVVCASAPEPFGAVGAWYLDFSQTSDREVVELLAESSRQASAGSVG